VAARAGDELCRDMMVCMGLCDMGSLFDTNGREVLLLGFTPSWPFL
jgi:hypothetical protein